MTVVTRNFQNGHKEVAVTLIECGADVDKANNKQAALTPLYRAAMVSD